MSISNINSSNVPSTTVNSSTANSFVSFKVKVNPMLSVMRKRQELIKSSIKVKPSRGASSLCSVEVEAFKKLQENLKVLTENEHNFKIARCEASARASQESSDESFVITVDGDQRSASQLLSSLEKLDAFLLGDVENPIEAHEVILAEAQISELNAIRQYLECRKYLRELKVKVKDFIE